jgi:formate hydrogenlyase subunit 3/multisubunit Na+/H+ antiporter MnhD subunit
VVNPDGGFASIGFGCRFRPVALIALVLMTGGLMMKAALFPMHFWLPPAHSSAPAPVSALLSALVVKGSIYLLWRLWFEGYSGVLSAGSVQYLGVLGALAILWGSLQALIQERLKLLIAYSTVAQLGYLFLVFPLAWDAGSTSATAVWTGGLIFLAGHATAKAALFLAAGNMIRAAGHDRIRDLDGMAEVLPVSAFALGLAGISLIGLPPSAGFVGKWLLLTAGLAQDQWWWALVIVGGSLLGAAYVMRVLLPAFARVPERKGWQPVARRLEWSALALALLSMVMGVGASVAARLLEQGGGGR